MHVCIGISFLPNDIEIISITTKNYLLVWTELLPSNVSYYKIHIETASLPSIFAITTLPSVNLKLLNGSIHNISLTIHHCFRSNLESGVYVFGKTITFLPEDEKS